MTSDAQPTGAKLCLVTGATGYIGGRLVPELLEAPTVAGVESVAGDAVIVRLTARAAPQESLTVARELRERLKEAFDVANVRVPVLARPYPAQASRPGGTSPT